MKKCFLIFGPENLNKLVRFSRGGDVNFNYKNLMTNNILIIQTRMESTRLPGKMLMRLGGKSLISNIIDTVIKIRDIDKIVISIPKTSKK